MAISRIPFTVVNNVVNPVIAAVLRSPAHQLLSHNMLLLTVTGRRSGKRFTFPVSYVRRAGDTVNIGIVMPESKLWWRNLTDGGAPVTVLLRGSEIDGFGVVVRKANSAPYVKIALKR